MKPDLFSLIIIFGATQGFFLAFIYFISKKGNKKANRIFGTLLFLISLSILTSILRFGVGFTHKFFHIYESLQFLFGPVLYFLVLIVCFPNHKMKKDEYLNFLPFVVYFLFFLFYLLPIELSKKIGSFTNRNSYGFLLEIVSTLHMWIYILVSKKKLFDYRKQLKNSFSEIKSFDLNWLKGFLEGMVIIYSIFILLFISTFIFDINLIFYTRIITVVATFFLYVIAYSLIIHPTFLISLKTVPTVAEKYKNSPLNEQSKNDYYEILKSIIEKENLFLNQELKLQNIAKKMDVPQQYLSQIINEKAKINFFDFINQYRVNEVIHRIEKGQHKTSTLLGIAYDSGFKSKATFNNSFKKFTRKTPSQFIKEKGLT